MSSSRHLELENTVTIAASSERVWEVFTDAARWPAWSRVIAAVTAVPETWSVGERLAFRLRIGPGTVPFDVTLIDVEPLHRVAWRSVRWTVTGTRTHTFATRPDGIEVTDHKHFAHERLPIRWFYPTPPITRMSRTWLDDLRREAERTKP